jgi:hypothetical protein
MIGEVKPSLPSMLFSSFTSPPSSNRYFQYRAIFETDSGDLNLGPELKSTSVDPIHYPTEAPIATTTGVPFLKLGNLSETLGSGGCSSGLGYNLSLDGTSWRYWNGSSWVIANGTAAQSNAASVMSDHIANFASEVGVGTAYLKAFLRSSGTIKCELDALRIDGMK